MTRLALDGFRAEIAALEVVREVGRITAIDGGTVAVSGLSEHVAIGDLVEIAGRDGAPVGGEALGLAPNSVTVLPNAPTEGLSIGDRVRYVGQNEIAPDAAWLGRVIDPFGRPLDGRPLFRGAVGRPLRAAPPDAAVRRPLGARLETGLAVFNTLLPIARGQRIGLFAGSGVGKSILLAKLARGLRADVVVIALIGERGRELREFVDRALGPEGLGRAVVVAATSDKSPLVRRRCAWTAMAVAEHFRDAGAHVLFLADSVTRFAEAHREVALAAGEESSLRGFPPSTAHLVTSLCERAGPGSETTGDITAVLSVLVAASDMDEPIADLLRGVLDGHVVLDRAIAERGRFPAVDPLRSVSRSLPDAASPDENALISEARRRLGAYDRAELMVQSGLYAAGSDPDVDAAIAVWPKLDAFLAEDELQTSAESFQRLAACLHSAA